MYCISWKKLIALIKINSLEPVTVRFKDAKVISCILIICLSDSISNSDLAFQVNFCHTTKMALNSDVEPQYSGGISNKVSPSLTRFVWVNWCLLGARRKWKQQHSFGRVMEGAKRVEETLEAERLLCRSHLRPRHVPLWLRGRFQLRLECSRRLPEYNGYRSAEFRQSLCLFALRVAILQERWKNNFHLHRVPRIFSWVLKHTGPCQGTCL